MGMRREIDRFVWSGVAFLVLVLGLLAAVAVWGPPLSRNDYMGAMRTKHARLAALEGPRTIIVGGSNAAFGIDSERLEEAFGRPVANMALHASLGLGFMVNEVKDELRKGDLVLLVPEYSQYRDAVRTEQVLYSLLDQHPQALSYVDPLDRPQLVLAYGVRKLQAGVSTLYGASPGVWDTVYTVSGFDQRGDMLAHLDRPAPGFTPDTTAKAPKKQAEVDPAFWRITDELVQRAQAVGAQVVLCWPAFAGSQGSDRWIAKVQGSAGAEPLARVGVPEDYLFADSLFYDTPSHLTASGRALRTERLVRDLRTVLRSKGAE